MKRALFAVAIDMFSLASTSVFAEHEKISADLRDRHDTADVEVIVQYKNVPKMTLLTSLRTASYITP